MSWLPRALRPEGSKQKDRMPTENFKIPRFPTLQHWRENPADNKNILKEIHRFRETQEFVGVSLYEGVGRADIKDILAEVKSWSAVELAEGDTIQPKQRVWLAMAVWADYGDTCISDHRPLETWKDVGNYIVHPSEAQFVWTSYGTLNERWKLATALKKPSKRIPERTVLDEVLYILQEGSKVDGPGFKLEVAPEETPDPMHMLATEDPRLVKRSDILKGPGPCNEVAIRLYEFLLMKLTMIQMAMSLDSKVRENYAWLEWMKSASWREAGDEEGDEGPDGEQNGQRKLQSTRPHSASRARQRSTSRPARKKYPIDRQRGCYTDSGCTYYYQNGNDWQSAQSAQWEAAAASAYDWSMQPYAAMDTCYYDYNAIAWAAASDAANWAPPTSLANATYGGKSSSSAPPPPGLGNSSYGGSSSSSAPPPPPGLEMPAYPPKSAVLGFQ